MQQADMRIDALDDFAVELQHQTQHAVRRRMLRSEVDGEIAEVLVGHWRHPLWAVRQSAIGNRQSARFRAFISDFPGALHVSNEAKKHFADKLATRQ